MAAPKVTLKLLIDTENNKVLFAEAGKGFMDFLVNMTLLPVGSFLRLFDEEEDMGGSLGSLYQSINKLGKDYVLQKSKEALLNPKVVDDHNISCLTHLLPNVTQSQSSDESPNSTAQNTGYGLWQPAISYTGKNCKCSNCNNHFNYTTLAAGQYCPYCGGTLVVLDDKQKSSGHVRGFTYIIMDDLAVSPMSILPTITLLHTKFNIKDVSTTVEERLVDVGRDEALKLLKTSMLSKTVLTDVFLRNNNANGQQLNKTTRKQMKSEDADDFVNL
ncbi:hypothetical protein COLO4_10956 [Corchorus olitorius]|uniref:DUF674 domain-containing protein n=1 Tax=Corchorus olitorius TaxID=93759 RepID=A0A1R3K6K6_9ROSI|nr:hypothetical protein COLO4_10956 [Corchorus olitorius]